MGNSQGFGRGGAEEGRQKGKCIAKKSGMGVVEQGGGKELGKHKDLSRKLPSKLPGSLGNINGFDVAASTGKAVARESGQVMTVVLHRGIQAGQSMWTPRPPPPMVFPRVLVIPLSRCVTLGGGGVLSLFGFLPLFSLPLFLAPTHATLPPKLAFRKRTGQNNPRNHTSSHAFCGSAINWALEEPTRRRTMTRAIDPYGRSPIYPPRNGQVKAR